MIYSTDIRGPAYFIYAICVITKLHRYVCIDTKSGIHITNRTLFGVSWIADFKIQAGFLRLYISDRFCLKVREVNTFEAHFTNDMLPTIKIRTKIVLL